MIKVRNYKQEDALQTWQLFYNTIRTINIRDYSSEQVAAWAPDEFDLSIWTIKMDSINPFIAELDGVIVGYSDLQETGLIDHFFCHSDYQGQGVGKALMTHILEQRNHRGIHRIYSEVSITAKTFYERFGFSVVKEQHIDVRGQKLTNYLMEQCLSKYS